MITVPIGQPTQANCDTAMATAGFTKITAESTASASFYKWEDNAVVKILFESSTGVISYVIDNTAKSMLTLNDSSKLCYEALRGGGIAMGWTDGGGTPLQLIFSAPRTSADDWAFIAYDLNYVKLYDYSRQDYVELSTNNIYDGLASNDLQIIKIYNGVRFMDNIYRTLLEPTLADNASVRATFGQQNFLLVKLQPTNDRHCWAVEL